MNEQSGKSQGEKMIRDTEPTGMSARGDLLITRMFDAPRELVWQAWTDPKHFKRWWGPRDYTCPFCEMDFSVGGKYLNCMRSPKGKDYWSTGVFREIILMERIVFTDCFADEQGNVVPATYYGMSADFPLEMLVTVTFEESGNGTRLTLKHEGLPGGSEGEGAGQGWNQSFDKLAESLK
jgi:uncharacterized protein YndB with AHSA1/START domain